jgi:hydroxymethylpyrimidine/phosphomethylpyrimidine kinase
MEKKGIKSELKIQFPDNDWNRLEKLRVESTVKLLGLETHLVVLQDKIRRNKEELQQLLQSQSTVLSQKEDQENIIHRLEAEQILIKEEMENH